MVLNNSIYHVSLITGINKNGNGNNRVYYYDDNKDSWDQTRSLTLPYAISFHAVSIFPNIALYCP